MGSMSIWHWILVLAVGLLLFGGRGKNKDFARAHAPPRRCHRAPGAVGTAELSGVSPR